MIWLVGNKGMLGSDLEFLLKEEEVDFVGTDLDVDITDPKAVSRFLDNNRSVTSIVNCAAYTDVEKAEDEKEKAFKINAEGPAVLSRHAEERDIFFVHVSTDYVFPGTGDKPWDTTDRPCPLNAYGETKLQGERYIQASGCRFAIVRTQWMYGKNGRNFVNTIVEKLREGRGLKVIDDQYGAVTWSKDLAGILLSLVVKEIEGIYHAVNTGYTTWFKVAVFIKEVIGSKTPVSPCKSEDYASKAERPKNSRMSVRSLTQAGLHMRNWKEALQEYLKGAGL